MEKQEKYLYIWPLRKHIGCIICKSKFSHRFEKFKMEIREQCIVVVRAMGAMGARMSGRLRQG